MIKTRLNIVFVFWANGTAKKRGAIAHVPSILCIPPVFVIGTPKFANLQRLIC